MNNARLHFNFGAQARRYVGVQAPITILYDMIGLSDWHGLICAPKTARINR